MIIKDFLFGLSILGLSIAAAIAEYRIYNTDFSVGIPDFDSNNGNALFGGNLSIFYFYNSGIYAGYNYVGNWNEDLEHDWGVLTSNCELAVPIDFFGVVVQSYEGLWYMGEKIKGK